MLCAGEGERAQDVQVQTPNGQGQARTHQPRGVEWSLHAGCLRLLSLQSHSSKGCGK